MEHYTASVDGLRLHYTQGPPNGAPLVLLHGLTSRLQSWDYLLPDLVPNWQVYAVDLRGHGLSDQPFSGYTFSDYAGDIAGFLKQFVREPAVLLGHSLGAMTALLVAAQAGPAVRGLILCDPPFTTWHTTIANTPPFQAWFQFVLQAKTQAQSLPDLQSICRSAMPNLTDDALAELAETLWQVAPGAAEAALTDAITGTTNIWAELSKINCPALFLQGQKDLGAALWDEAVDRIRQAMPQAVVLKLAGFGHSTHMAVGDILAQLQAFREMQ